MIELGKTQIVTGRINRIIYRDQQSGYTVFSVITEEDAKEIVCSSTLVAPRERSLVEVTGTWKNTKRGPQLVDCVVEESFNDPETALELLKKIPTVGEATAKLLVTQFGNNIFDVALSEAGITKLSSVPGVSKNRAQAIVDWAKETTELRNLFSLLKKYDVTYSQVAKIFKEYGVVSVAKLLADPFKVGRNAGIHYQICDAIAKDLAGIKVFDERRIVGAVNHVLTKEANSGHSFTPYSSVVTMVKKMLDVTLYTETIASACIGRVLRDGKHGFVLDEDRVYLESLYIQERRVASAISRINRSAQTCSFDKDALVTEVENDLKVKYDKGQAAAFSLLETGGVGIVTGGPGTGKTTVIRGLIAAFRKLNPNGKIKGCAPTGRAAQRMSEACKNAIPTSTIHRLLDFRPFEGGFTNKNELDPIDADLLLVDEASMISLEVAALLCGAIRNGTTVIFTGDPDQLPAVGAGNFLLDLMQCGRIPVCALTKTFRQAGESLIIDNAKRIRDGITSMKKGSDFEVLEADDSDIPVLVKELFEKWHDPNDIFACQVLTPARRKYSSSTSSLNPVLQALANPTREEFLRYGGTTFCLRDKVMFTRNNYEAGYNNGDCGTIVSVAQDSLSVKVGDEVIPVEHCNLDDLTLAYATTIHKSQGSEYTTAICVLGSEPKSLLQRNVLYTAITRAKKRVILVVAQGSIATCVLNRKTMLRRSNLQALLQGKE